MRAHSAKASSYFSRGIRAEESEDAVRVADADLNVIQGAEAGGGVERFPLDEKPSDSIERAAALTFVERVEQVHHCTVKEASLRFRAFLAIGSPASALILTW